MRLFIGIKTGCEDALVFLQSELKKTGKGRFTDTDNLHLTIRFLGEVPFQKLGEVKEAMSEIKGAAFELECLGIKVFSNSGIVSAEVGGELDKLNGLYQSLAEALEKRGFEKETRAYRPHITLARNYRAIGGADIETLPYHRRRFMADELILFESRREDGRLVYVPLYSRKLDISPE